MAPVCAVEQRDVDNHRYARACPECGTELVALVQERGDETMWCSGCRTSPTFRVDARRLERYDVVDTSSGTRVWSVFGDCAIDGHTEGPDGPRVRARDLKIGEVARDRFGRATTILCTARRQVVGLVWVNRRHTYRAVYYEADELLTVLGRLAPLTDVGDQAHPMHETGEE